MEEEFGSGRYFIGCDNSGHEYLVPVEHKKRWEIWSEIPDDDERKWDEPLYATRIEGTLTFEKPEL